MTLRKVCRLMPQEWWVAAGGPNEDLLDAPISIQSQHTLFRVTSILSWNHRLLPVVSLSHTLHGCQGFRRNQTDPCSHPHILKSIFIISNPKSYLSYTLIMPIMFRAFILKNKIIMNKDTIHCSGYSEISPIPEEYRISRQTWLAYPKATEMEQYA